MLEKTENINIENMIYEIRGTQVMVDSDLARLYECKNGTKEINQAVKNNPEKFPERFAFRITEEEYNFLKSKFLTSKTRGGSRKGHTVFTEQGVAMLATILKTSIATQVSIAIMDTFVKMRKYISSNLLEQKYINNQVMKNTEDIKLLQESFKQFSEHKPLNEIFFEGQIYDAYSLLLDIFESSKDSIIIIDNFADKKLLDLLSKTNKNITIISSNMNEELIKKYKKQYSNVNIINNDSFHDRFIIIDNKTLYHSGASFKDLGKKCFAISELKNEYLLKNLLQIVNS